MVNILWRIFGKSGKKLKMKSHDQKTSFSVKNLFCLKLAKIGMMKGRWNTYTMYAVQLICTNF